MRTPGALVRDSPVRGWLIGSLVLLSLTLVGVLAALLSPTAVYWTGTQVPGTERGGVVYYSYAGQQYTVTGPGDPTDRVPHPTKVFLHPDEPTEALVDDARRKVDLAFVLVWPLAAALCLLTGYVRLWRRRRRRPTSSDPSWPPPRRTPAA